MAIEHKEEERRTHTRFRVKEGAFAALSPDSSIMGQIENISRGGLCFRYIVHEEQADELEATHIFVGMEGFYLEKMPYQTVDDVEIESGASLKLINMRRRRIQFMDLTTGQSAQLNYFLDHRTSGKSR